MALKSKRFLSAVCAAIMAVSFTAPQLVTAADAVSSHSTVTISSAEELLDFAQKCSLDSWSKGKTFTLNADVDLGYAEFSPIPIFGGSFDGNGHSISGLKITAKGSDVGLFRYVEKGGTVKNLDVAGMVIPDGSKNSVGGIVGKNNGTIQNCSFQGSVGGESSVGGIAGCNADSGKITDCNSAGAIHGKTATGGIAGSNSGTILKCTNDAGINLTQSDTAMTPSDIDVDKILGSDTEEDNILNSCSDTGGIAGYSDGIVQSCVNNGDVGYPHVGYNTGGIAGRQSGYLSGCTNNGSIHGRKEVGGIVGQTEPYLSITPSEDLLDELQAELDKLSEMIDGVLDDAKGISVSTSEHLANIKGSADSAKNSAQNISDSIGDFVDDNIDAVNMKIADISNAIDLAKPAADDLAELGTEISVIADALSDAIDIIKSVSDITDSAVRDVENSVDDLKKCADELKELSEKLGDALDALQNSITEDDKQAVRDALDALSDVIDAANDLLKRISDDADSTGKIEDWITGGDVDNSTQNDIDALTDALEKFGDTLRAVSDMLPDLEDGLDSAGDKLKGASDNAENAADDLWNALDSVSKAIDDLKPANDLLNDALDKLGTAADHTSYAGTLASHAFGCISDSLDSLANIGENPFRPLGGDVRRESDSLFDTLSNIFDEAQALNTDFTDQTNAVTDKLKDINQQVGVITDLVIDEIRSVSDSSDYIQDTSEEDIAATREGKVSSCRNNGAVEGDRNIGGIAGAMAIEYDLDPEDDVTNNLSVRARFETKSVLQSCVNYGGVTAKKDCAGGIAGRMDLGTMISSQNYGEIAGADYVGGAAGYADASIRGCFIKCRLSGSAYIGGIAGYADRLSGCRAITDVLDGSEFIGAVAGKVSEDGELKDNGFVDTGLAGIDGISYSGKAEPITFEQLSAVKGVPAEMLTFSIILNADGELVRKIPFSYGQDLSETELPEVPEKDGFYGVWPDFDKSGKSSDIVLEAEYKHIVTIIQSEALDGKLALALVSGTFTDDTELTVEEQDIEKPASAGKNAKIYHLNIKNSDVGENDVVPVRILNPGKGRAEVRILSDGKWQTVSAEQVGKYMLVDMTGTEATFCIYSPNIAWIPFAAAGAAVIAALIIVLSVRKAKKRRKAAIDNVQLTK